MDAKVHQKEKLKNKQMRNKDDWCETTEEENNEEGEGKKEKEEERRKKEESLPIDKQAQSWKFAFVCKIVCFEPNFLFPFFFLFLSSFDGIL